MARKQNPAAAVITRHYLLNIAANGKADLISRLAKIIAALKASTDDDPSAAWHRVGGGSRDEGPRPRPVPGDVANLWEHEVQRQMEEGERPFTRRDGDWLRQSIAEDIERQFQDPVRRRSGVAPDNEFRGSETMYQAMIAYAAECFPPGHVAPIRRLLGRIRSDVEAGGDGKQFRLNLAAAKDPTLSRDARAEATTKAAADRDRLSAAGDAIKERRRGMREADAGRPRKRSRPQPTC